jgi:uncharacterized protein YciI
MKHFLIEITFTAEPKQMAAVRPEHRAYVQTGFERGLLLFSGLQKPTTGGMVVARAKSRSEIERFFAFDPYRLKGIATYRFVEFSPVFYQRFLESWMKA